MTFKRVNDISLQLRKNNCVKDCKKKIKVFNRAKKSAIKLFNALQFKIFKTC